LLAYYYNTVKDGVINDRWQQISPTVNWLVKIPPLRKRMEQAIAAAFSSGSMPVPRNVHTDYSTPEYSTLKEISERKWECVRGIGHSFGYNATEADENFLSGPGLVTLLVDIVSKNGNLLLNIGPKADGSIPARQLKPLMELGEWLGTYGEAIFATRPWTRPSSMTSQANPIHFTRTDQHLYLIGFGLVNGQHLEIPDFRPSANATACWLGTGQSLDWQMKGDFCEISLPAQLETAAAHVVRFASY
jgi:alpha-L-fucosidase